MQLLLYGLPMPILSRWIIAETKPHLESWVDIGSGNGEVLKYITIKPKKGIMIDVVH
ncbi:MAG: hypothetical protein ACYC49_02410 [Ignavibacteriaceae bacterium]